MLRRHTSFLSFLYELSPYRSFLPQFLRAKILFYNSCCKLFITGETLIQETNRGNRALHSIGIRSAANELHELLYIVHGILWRDKMLVGSSFFHGKILNYHRSLMQGFHVSRAIRVFCPSRPLFSINIIHLEELKRKKLQSRIPASSTSKNFIPALNYPLSVTKEKIVPSISVSAVTNKITTNFRRNIIDPI